MFFFFNDTATTEIYTLSLHDALPISRRALAPGSRGAGAPAPDSRPHGGQLDARRPDDGAAARVAARPPDVARARVGDGGDRHRADDPGADRADEPGAAR